MNDLTAIVLAGGYSSRFYPYSSSGHKTMIKIMGKPILEYTLLGLKAAGIREIILRVSEDKVIKNYFGNGKKFGLKITYIAQKEALGMGEVLLNAKRYLKGDFILISANHVNSKELIEELVKSKKKSSKGVVLVKKRENPWDYGVAEIKNGKLIRIIEKPEKGKEPSKFCLVSAFLLPLDIIDVVAKLEMSEYNFEEEALSLYAKDNPLDVAVVSEETVTLKYPWDLLVTKNFLLERKEPSVSKRAEISKSAEILGKVIIEDGAKILEGAKIKGPCYIGKNVTIGTNTLIRDGACIEEECVIGAYMEIRNSLVMEQSTTHAGFIGDSVIGRGCKLGTGFNTANVRLDRETVKAVVRGQKIDTGLKHFGAVLGNGVKVGIRASTMPGVIIGNNVVIGASTMVLRNVDDDVTYYAKFSEIVEKK